MGRRQCASATAKGATIGVGSL
uniref:Uncharacterized protein n=1 Tax=Arundo donax TaxID=35708 RepID=A0A0A8YA57_ARUDO